ncbi:MAG: aquaporin [Candidatus Gastranaerophilales bacterium]|nr:aquaporin [Candidatus Gastranaerophilales bacterium]
MKHYLTEFIGTFFLVLTVACCSYTGNPLGALAIASVLMVMVYAGGYISGGHYNPAVSLAACIRGALPYKEFVPYAVVQCLGGACAVWAFYGLVGHAGIFQPVDYNLTGLLIAETLFTFALCYVVLHTATSKETSGNSYYGLAIGFTVLVGAIAVGGRFCAGAFNPAVAVSLGMLGVSAWALAGYTILANLAGGVLAACVFKAVQTKSEEA